MVMLFKQDRCFFRGVKLEFDLPKGFALMHDVSVWRITDVILWELTPTPTSTAYLST
jgi:hypothetical protein